MKTRHSKLVLGSILTFIILVACGLTPMSTPTGSSGGAPTPVVITASSPTSTPVLMDTATAVVPISNPTAITPNGACDNAYYPHTDQSSWSYSSTGDPLGNYTYTRTISTVSDTGFTTTYAFSSGVITTIDWKCQDGNLAALDAGNSSFSMTTSKVKMTSNSVTADGYNIPASFESGKTWAEKVIVKGTVTSNTGKTVDSQIVSQLSCTSAGNETISVPAGKFDTVKASCTKDVVVSALEKGKAVPLNGNQENITYWYAKAVGFVKSVATGGSNNETIELTHFTIK